MNVFSLGRMVWPLVGNQFDYRNDPNLVLGTTKRFNRADNNERRIQSDKCTDILGNFTHISMNCGAYVHSKWDRTGCAGMEICALPTI